jgi:hypothetical protein
MSSLIIDFNKMALSGISSVGKITQPFDASPLK